MGSWFKKHVSKPIQKIPVVGKPLAAVGSSISQAAGNVARKPLSIGNWAKLVGRANPIGAIATAASTVRPGLGNYIGITDPFATLNVTNPTLKRNAMIGYATAAAIAAGPAITAELGAGSAAAVKTVEGKVTGALIASGAAGSAVKGSGSSATLAANSKISQAGGSPRSAQKPFLKAFVDWLDEHYPSNHTAPKNYLRG